MSDAVTPDRTLQSLRPALRHDADADRCLPHLSGFNQKITPGIRQGHRTRCTFEQGKVQAVFQGADLPPDRWLGQSKVPGGCR